MSSRRDWSTAEIETLRQGYREGVPLQDIAQQLNRSHASVKSMAQRLGLKRPAPGADTVVKPLKPAKYSMDLEEAFRLMSGVLLRLQRGPVSRDEIRFLGLAVKALDSYMKMARDFTPIPGSKEYEEED